MTPQNADTHEVLTFAELQPLASANGPHLTALVSLTTPSEIEVRIKNAMRGLQRKAAERGGDPDTSAALIAPIRDLATAVQTEGVWAHALILFRSPDLFRYYWLHGQFQDMQADGDWFQVRPLLRTLAHETRFYLLALSQHHVRLLVCTQHRAEPADTGTNIPRNLEDWMNNRQPDHLLATRSFAGRSIGGMKGVVSGTGTERERSEEYLAHFFKEVDKAVTARLRGETRPLVLAGVDRELAIYRRVNSYRPTLEKAVPGSPDGLPDRALHERAMEVVMGIFTEPLRKALSDIGESAGTPRCSIDPRSIVQAAFQGRVRGLLIAANAEYRGAWNEETQDVDTGNPTEELLNAAALQTVRQGGRAFVVNEADMPVNAPAAALFHF
ncbi:MAG TPA: hypothetical protein VME43_17475 [Bryobacteraceae bacterium]|nr:hypothetical protein [Bryobacteraceae bacterium]